MLDFHALIPTLSDRCGHEFPYQTAIQATLDSLEVSYTAHIGKDSEIDTLPPNWHRTLEWKRYKKKWRQFLPRFFECLKLFKQTRGVKRFFFLDQFALTDVLPTLLAFWLQGKKNDWLCIQVRFESKWKRLYRLLFRWNKRALLICDSELLAADYEKCIIFPIPFATQLMPKKLGENILLWCPGYRRKEKRRELVEALTRSEKIEIIETQNLTRDAYIKQFEACDAVLLPYDPKAYGKRSSGIFVEAIVSGRFPFVSDHTWLAYELRKHDLSELIVDFNRQDLLEVIEVTIRSHSVRSKLFAMREAYLAFHTQEGLKTSFETLFSLTSTLTKVR